MADRLNILLLHTHDAGRMIEPYGHPVVTPNLLRFAGESVLFRQAFAAAPTCSPSRAALMTGQYPHCCGMHGLATAKHGYALNDYSQHLARFLSGHRYTTALAGVQHEACGPLVDPALLGYRRMLNHDAHGHFDHGRTLAAALGFITEAHDRPFFLSCGFNAPHRDNPNQADLRRRLDEWISQTNDPFANGIIPPPTNALSKVQT